MNITITVPEGSSNHGNPTLLCIPPNWYDYVIFYFTNYFAHSASLVTAPGEGPWDTFLVVLSALLLPASGVTRAARAIFRGANLTRHPLRRAARSGALCMLVKKDDGIETAQTATGEHCSVVESEAIRGGGDSEHCKKMDRSRYQDGPLTETTAGEISGAVSPNIEVADTTVKDNKQCTNGGSTKGIYSHDAEPLRGNWWKDNRTLLHHGAKIHGEYRFSDSYQLVLIPPHVPLEFGHGPGGGHSPVNQELACNYNVPKLLISLAQATWATITIYRARGDQIDQYGYAAFGLTVVPYAFMSVVNVIAGLLTPEYSAVFMIRTPIMEEAEKNGGAFFRGEIYVKSPEADDSMYGDIFVGDELGFRHLTIGGMIGLIPLAIIGGLSSFQMGSSTSLQRGFTMSWLVVGLAFGAQMPTLLDDTHEIIQWNEGRSRAKRQFRIVLIMLLRLLALGPCAIGGMVVVGLMIRDYGICIRVD